MSLGSLSQEVPTDFLSVEEARGAYGLGEQGTFIPNSLEDQMLEMGIAEITMPLRKEQFETLTGLFDACVQKVPELLAQTYMKIDHRLGNVAGYERKDLTFRPDGIQAQDGKSLFHFNETARREWEEKFKHAEWPLKDFLECGYVIQDELLTVARGIFEALEGTHPNIFNAYFPNIGDNDLRSLSFMRVLSYDGYTVGELDGDVAKPHYDISGATIQAYADAPGFWGSVEGIEGERTYYDSHDGNGHFFLGQGHEKLYGPDSRLKALAHGVGRITLPNVTEMPNRHSVVMFIDTPDVDLLITPKDTLPQLFPRH